jgi:hypothetical protein
MYNQKSGNSNESLGVSSSPCNTSGGADVSGAGGKRDKSLPPSPFAATAGRGRGHGGGSASHKPTQNVDYQPKQTASHQPTQNVGRQPTPMVNHQPTQAISHQPMRGARTDCLAAALESLRWSSDGEVREQAERLLSQGMQA